MPAWYDQDARRFFMSPAVGVPLVDIDIGVLADSAAMDSDTANAYEFVKNSFAETFFGNILSASVAKLQVPVIKRRAAVLRSFMKAPVTLVFSQLVYKETERRIFRIKVSDGEALITCSIYVIKRDGKWLFEDLQDLKTLSTRTGVDRAERKIRFDWEGWIPNGN